jgi:hypothetical protein
MVTALNYKIMNAEMIETEDEVVAEFDICIAGSLAEQL